MNNKIINFDAQERMLEGVQELARAVTSTLGPKGRNVTLYDPQFGQHPTKDGVTVARSIRFSDQIKDAGAKYIQDAANKTVYLAGDGTTTSTLLGYLIMSHGMNALKSGSSPVEVNEGIEYGVKRVVESLNHASIRVNGDMDMIEKVAAISSNNDAELGRIIRQAVEEVGEDGVIYAGDHDSNETKLEIIHGQEIPSGIIMQELVNTPRGTCEYDDCYICVVDDDVATIKEIAPLIKLSNNEKVNVLLFAHEVVGEARSAVLVNNQKGLTNICFVNIPGLGEIRRTFLRDISLFTGATIFGEDFGRDIAQLDHENPVELGRATKIISSPKTTLLVGGAGDRAETEKEIEIVKTRWEENKHNEQANLLYRERLQRLRAKAAVILVGEVTEQALRAKRDRVDDAIKATKASIEEGIVVGGGLSYLRCMADVVPPENAKDGFKKGVEVVRRSLTGVMAKILENAGEKVEILDTILRNKCAMGYDAKSGKFVDMLEAGIINPAKVDRVAIENAASAAMMMLITECVIYPDPATYKPVDLSRR